MSFESNVASLLRDAVNLPVTPSFGTGELPFLVYNHTPQEEGPVKQSQLEVKIISEDFDLIVDNLYNKVVSALTDDKGKTITYEDITFVASLSGGGYVYEDSLGVWEYSLIFIIKWRYRNE